MMNRLTLMLAAPMMVAMASAALQEPLKTGNGMLSGAAGNNPEIRVFKGIPYAAPPVGNMRWRAPEAPASWEGVKQATAFSPVCMQEPYPKDSVYYSAPSPTNEDCLYLNVWTAAKSNTERRPVMVWIHGGGYTRGSGETATYNGEHLAEKGAVVVTVNYRLGIFGFMAHPELTKESSHHASGDYGLLDMVAALRWVQANIAAFGGDPKRVTIFGESAGSSAVNFLVASPLAKGLFQRAIGESGANFGRDLPLADAERAGAKVGASISDLRAKSAEELMAVKGSFRPDVDGWFLPQTVSAIFEAGKQSDVPIIAGSNQDESRTLQPYPANGTQKSFLEQTHKRYGASTDEFLKLYPAGSDEQAAEAHYASTRDAGMGWEMRTWARMQTKTGHAPAYLYYFTRIPPGPTAQKYRAYHAAEIQYAFDNLNPSRPWQDEDKKLAEAMSSYWVNFAATGNPNGKGLPQWPKYEAKSDPFLVFGDQIAVQHEVNKTALDFFDRYFASQNPAGGTH